MTDFKYGPTVTIDELSENAAIAIFGREVYEAWKGSVGPPQRPGLMVVAKVDRKARVVTLKAEDV